MEEVEEGEEEEEVILTVTAIPVAMLKRVPRMKAKTVPSPASHWYDSEYITSSPCLI